ncbi:MAG: hypothetical protein H7838_00995 [Magnetococcus sp. DMHC-8]
MMKKTGMVGLLMGGLFGLMAWAWAGTVADATRASLMEAREGLVALLAAATPESQNKRLGTIRLATAKVDVLIDKNGEALREFSEVWRAFKATRDGELIPGLLAGKQDEAKALATGIQAERFKKMLDILGKLDR